MPRRTLRRRPRRIARRKAMRRRRTRRSSDVVIYKPSLRTHYIQPTRYFVWLETYVQGYISPGAASYTWQLSMNEPQHPLNNTGATTNKWPTPLASLSSYTPAGFKNLLQTSATGSGLYVNVRVWRCKGQVTIMPQNAGDELQFAIAPNADAGAAYSSFLTIAQGPGSKTKQISSATSSAANTLRFNYSIPKLLGIPKKDYSALTTQTYNSDGVLAGTPVYLQLYAQNSYNSNFVDAVAVQGKFFYLCEFFNRSDTQIYDT